MWEEKKQLKYFNIYSAKYIFIFNEIDFFN